MKNHQAIPQNLLWNEKLQRCTSFQRDLLFSSLLIQDDNHCLPFDPVLLRSLVFPGRPSINRADITSARDHLISIGIYTKNSSFGKEWLAISPEFWMTEEEQEASTHAGPEDEHLSGLWKDLCTFLGPEESAANGHAWRSRIEENPIPLATALQEAKEGSVPVADRPAFLLDRYTAHGGE